MEKIDYGMTYLNACRETSERTLRTMSDWACEPCPSRQQVTLPMDYVAKGERARGALAAVGVIAGIGAAIAAALCAKKSFD